MPAKAADEQLVVESGPEPLRLGEAGWRVLGVGRSGHARTISPVCRSRPLVAFARLVTGRFALRPAGIGEFLMHAPVPTAVDATAFAIGFDQRDRARLHELWDERPRLRALDARATSRSARGRLGEHDGLPACAIAGWTGGALAALEFADVRGRDRPLPLEHVHGDAARHPRGRRPRRRSSTATARTSASPSRTSSAKAERHAPARRLPRPHRRPHRLRVERIADYCRAQRDLPDRGLRPRTRRELERPAARLAGATPASTRFTRRRRSRPARAACSSRTNPDLVDFARAYRNYGKPDYEVQGLGLPHERVHRRARPRRRSSGSTRSSAGRTRPPARISTRSSRSRVELPEGMISGLYKYVVFEPLERSTGPRLRRAVPPHPRATSVELPNTDWVAREPLVRAALLPRPRAAGRRRVGRDQGGA